MARSKCTGSVTQADNLGRVEGHNPVAWGCAEEGQNMEMNLAKGAKNNKKGF